MPGGRLGDISAIFALTASMTALAFSPVRMTTMPPTTSWPSISRAPRRKSPPIWTLAISRRRIGDVWPPTSIFSKSETDSTSPNPRMTNSMPFSSMTLPPTLRLLRPRASMTSWSKIPRSRIFAGETSIWYCRTKPPTDATSATPGTAFNWNLTK